METARPAWISPSGSLGRRVLVRRTRRGAVDGLEVAGDIGDAGEAHALAGLSIGLINRIHQAALRRPDAQLLVAAQGKARPAVLVQLDPQIPARRDYQISRESYPLAGIRQVVGQNKVSQGYVGR